MFVTGNGEVSVVSDSECWLCLLQETVKFSARKIFRRSQNSVKCEGGKRKQRNI